MAFRPLHWSYGTEEMSVTKFDGDEAAEVHRHLHSHLPSDPALRVKALESLVVERGMVAPETLDAWVETYAEHIGPKRGAQVVARAWLEPEFRARLAENATDAVSEFGFEGHAAGNLKAVFNTPTQHNIVVCTLCSCYPFAILGMSPAWYKSSAYRARTVREPRKVLGEFGVELGPDVAVHVWDSTAELRYLVVPERPAGTEGWQAEALAGIVTRNAMIGTDRDLRTGDA